MRISSELLRETILSIESNFKYYLLYCPQGIQLFPGQCMPRHSVSDGGSPEELILSVFVSVGPWLKKIKSGFLAGTLESVPF